MKRALLALLMMALALGACSVPDLGQSNDDPVDPNAVQVAGVSFARPVGFMEIDPDDVASNGNAAVKDMAQSMGVDPAALVQVIKSFDLYLVKLAGLQGYADNVTVFQPGGAIPGGKALKAQFSAIGATRVKIGHVDTDLGEVTTATYSLRVGKATVQGQAIAVDADGTVIITVTTGERLQTKTLAKGILETLDEA